MAQDEIGPQSENFWGGIRRTQWIYDKTYGQYSKYFLLTLGITLTNEQPFSNDSPTIFDPSRLFFDNFRPSSTTF